MSSVKQSRSGGRKFLSEEWVRQVIDHVETTKRADISFQNQVGDLTLSTLYTVTEVPEGALPNYGRGHEARLLVHVVSGNVERVQFGQKARKQDAQLTVQIDYKTAKKLLLGKASPASTMLSSNVKVRSVNGFSLWSTIAARSLVTASRILRIARKVPTTY